MKVQHDLQPWQDSERSRCKPLHMMYVSAGQHHPNTMHGEVKELLEVDQEIVHAAINLVNSNKETTVMSWNKVHRATQEDGVLVRLMDHIQRGMPDTGLELEKICVNFTATNMIYMWWVVSCVTEIGLCYVTIY